jgi:hypothetical protein
MSVTRRMFFSLLAASTARPTREPPIAERPWTLAEIDRYLLYRHQVDMAELDILYGRMARRAFSTSSLKADVQQEYLRQIDAILRTRETETTKP